MILLIALLLALAAGWWWEHWHKQRDAKRAQCVEHGHEWGVIFDALDNPQWPTRRCRRCGAQDCFTRCVCGKVVNRQTQEIVDPEKGDAPG